MSDVPQPTRRDAILFALRFEDVPGDEWAHGEYATAIERAVREWERQSVPSEPPVYDDEIEAAAVALSRMLNGGLDYATDFEELARVALEAARAARGESSKTQTASDE